MSDSTNRAGEARPPAFPSVDRDQSATAWRPADQELFTPPPPPTEPVSRAPRTRTWRWLVAAVATIAVLAVVAGVGYLAIRRTGAPSAISHYAPADTAAYAEIDLSLPGDQHDQLAQFMSHFPGFADQASFQQKVDDTLNQLLVNSGSGLTWDQDVAPWFGNQVAFFGNPGTMSMTGSTANTKATPMVAVLSVSDSMQLGQLIQPRLTDAGASASDYDGEQLWTMSDGSNAVVVTENALLVGATQEVKQALDVKSGKQASLADDDFFLNQLASLHADRLATFYVDYGALLQSMSSSLDSLGSVGTAAPSLDLLNQFGSVKLVGEARAEGNHLAISMRGSHPTGDNVPPLPSNRHTALAERMPADSLVYFETRDVGQAFKFMFDTLLTVGPSPSTGTDLGLQSITDLLGTQPQDYLDFVQDAGVSVSYANDTLGVGLVATVDDMAVASTRVERLLSMVRLAAAGGTTSGLSIDVTDETHGDVTITVIHLASTTPVSPGSGTFDLKLGVAVANGQLLMGVGDFVANALDRTAADSLASNTRYQSAASVAGDNSGIGFVDIAGIRTALEQAIPSADQQNYEQNIKPFLAPLDYLLQYSTTDGDITETHVFLYVE